MSRVGTSMEPESRLVVVYTWRVAGRWGVTTKGCRGLGVGENVLKLIVVLVA